MVSKFKLSQIFKKAIKLLHLSTVCNLPAIPQFGGYEVSENGFDVVFFCDAGFTLKGSSRLTCRKDETGYNDSVPECGMLLECS